MIFMILVKFDASNGNLIKFSLKSTDAWNVVSFNSLSVGLTYDFYM